MRPFIVNKPPFIRIKIFLLILLGTFTSIAAIANQQYQPLDYDLPYGRLNPTKVEGVLFYLERIDLRTSKLWVTNGTKRGTRPVGKKHPRLDTLSIEWLEEFKGNLILVTYDHNLPEQIGGTLQLWRLSPDLKDLSLIKEWQTKMSLKHWVGKERYTDSITFVGIQKAQNCFYIEIQYFRFCRDSCDNAFVLYRSDGTPEGTITVGRIPKHERLFREFLHTKSTSDNVYYFGLQYFESEQVSAKYYLYKTSAYGRSIVQVTEVASRHLENNFEQFDAVRGDFYFTHSVINPKTIEGRQRSYSIRFGKVNGTTDSITYYDGLYENAPSVRFWEVNRVMHTPNKLFILTLSTFLSPDQSRLTCHNLYTLNLDTDSIRQVELPIKDTLQSRIWRLNFTYEQYAYLTREYEVGDSTIYELWRTDGIKDHTQKLGDLRAYNPADNLLVIDNQLVVRVAHRDGTYGYGMIDLKTGLYEQMELNLKPNRDVRLKMSFAIGKNLIFMASTDGNQSVYRYNLKRKRSNLIWMSSGPKSHK